MAKNEEFTYSKKIMASYGSRQLFGQWISSAFGFSVLFYYEAVIGLNVLLAALAYTIFSVWNAVNDPLIGYIMERIHMPWERKRGLKRFPWIIIGAVLWLFTYLSIFLIPLQWDPIADPSHQLPVFGWYLVSICLYDTMNTLFDVNVLSIYPVKFRGLDERRTVTGFGTIIGIFGLVISAIIPPMFIITGVRSTYVNAALVSVGMGFLFILLFLPGVWEDKRTREGYEQLQKVKEEADVESFFKTTKKTITDKRFMGKVILFFGYQVGAVMLQYSAFYIVTFSLDIEASGITLLLAAMMLGALISVPIWFRMSKKINDNRKISMYGGFVMFFTFIPLIFVSGLIGWMISLVFFGVGVGGQWFTDPVAMADVLDDIAVRTKQRRQGVYYGFQAFFIRLGNSSIVWTIAIVHTLTGFPEGVSSLDALKAANPSGWELAVFGIRIHAAIVPAIIVLISIFIFWRWYDLTPDKVAANREKLKELNI